jgi:hypothetical protein
MGSMRTFAYIQQFVPKPEEVRQYGREIQSERTVTKWVLLEGQ